MTPKTTARSIVAHLPRVILNSALVCGLFGGLATHTASAAKNATLTNGDGLVAYWNLDEGSGTTAADLTGNNGNLTLSGSQSFSTDVATLDFGSNAGVDYTASGSMGGSLGSTVQNLQTLSISLWVKPDTIPGSGVARWISLGNEKAVLRSQSGKLHFYMRIGGTLKGIQVSNVLTTGSYQHIVGTYDGSTMIVYRNGTQVGSLAATGTVDTSGTQVFTSSGSESFDGRLDDLRVYNRALSASEITTLYNGEECFVEATGDSATDYMSLTSDAAIESAMSAASAGATIKIAGHCNSASFTLTKNLTLEGGHTAGNWAASPNATTWPTTLDGESAGRIAQVNGSVVATLSYLKFANGAASDGAGVYNQGTLTVNYSTFTNNVATTDGGGLYNHNATATVSNSTFTSNSAKWGGGISNTGGTLNVSSSTFTSNSATQQGGGIYNWYALTLTGSTLNSNSAPYGGGVASNDDNDMTVISNSTIDGNTATTKGSEYYGFPAQFTAVNFGTDKVSVP